MTKKYKQHELGAIFPPTTEDELKALVEDIRERGLLSEIVLYEGKVLDGWHRYQACELAKVKPRFKHYGGRDALSYVCAMNLRRRHLDTGQRAMIAARLETMNHGGPRKQDDDEPPRIQTHAPTTRAQAAEALNVSPRTVATAAKVLDEAPRLAAKVQAGEITLGQAARKVDEKKQAAEELFDETGFKVPETLHGVWRSRTVVDELKKSVRQLECDLVAIKEANHPLMSGFGFPEWVAALQRFKQAVGRQEAFAVCTTCSGWNREKCSHCKGRGFLSKSQWQTDVPAEVKAIRAKSQKGGAK